MSEAFEKLRAILPAARAEVGKVIIGNEEVVDRALIAIFTRSHALVEGVPGVAKTLLVRTMAHVLGCPFNRIQFTPDLMPADIIGTSVFNLRDNEFHVVQGPVFTTFLLADEINRAPAKTQSALLQAMQERQVTIDRTTHPLSPRFTVFATQNPIEYEGTYPLPEAQVDRFLLKITMDPPALEGEIELAKRSLGSEAPEAVLERGDVQQVLHMEELDALAPALNEVAVREEMVRFVVSIVRQTREHHAVLVGAGPRASQGLLLGARVMAVLEGRDFVTPDDVKSLAHSVLAHRMVLRPEYEIEGMETADVLTTMMSEVTVPR